MIGIRIGKEGKIPLCRRKGLIWAQRFCMTFAFLDGDIRNYFYRFRHICRQGERCTSDDITRVLSIA